MYPTSHGELFQNESAQAPALKYAEGWPGRVVLKDSSGDSDVHVLRIVSQYGHRAGRSVPNTEFPR